VLELALKQGNIRFLKNGKQTKVMMMNAEPMTESADAVRVAATRAMSLLWESGVAML
jgi:hypothetical protein